MSDWRAWTNDESTDTNVIYEVALETNRCGLWWILSTVSIAIGFGIIAGIFLWLVLA